MDAAGGVLSIRIFPERDGNYIPLEPYEAYANGAAKDITFLQGCNKDEMNFFVSSMGVEGFEAWAADRKTKNYDRLLTEEEKSLVESYCKENATESWEPDSRLFGQSWFIAPACQAGDRGFKPLRSRRGALLSTPFFLSSCKCSGLFLFIPVLIQKFSSYNTCRQCKQHYSD